MEIKILNYEDEFDRLEIPDDFTFLRVTVMTGDEIIEVYRRDPKWGDSYRYETFDSGHGRRERDFFDLTYIVYPEQVEEWNERQSSYYMDKFNYVKFDNFQGYVSMR